MFLCLITGFLGSGKTTLVIRLVRAAAQNGLRTAVLVNEIGEVGIDNQLMRQLDLNVWELLGGCICCTLSGDLVTTLQRLDADYRPDLVLVEPSGAAEPSGILAALPYYRNSSLAGIQVITVVDPLRLPMLYEVMTPLIGAHIRLANLVMITKCDLASSEEIHTARQIVQQINPHAEIFQTDLQALSPALLQACLPCLN